ncbi:MAG TPA: hypothetical protein PKD93_13905 [Ferruginibacter sp.]|nr:hypothetical protein [Ferruginibacter sp.]
MKTFKNSKQVREEKKRLKLRRAELEKAIRYDWRDVKDSLRPSNIAGQVFSGVKTEKEKETEGRVDAGILSEIAAKFASKLAARAEDKIMARIGKWIKK